MRRFVLVLTILACASVAHAEVKRIVIDGHDKGTTTQGSFLQFHRYLAAMRERVLERMGAGKTLTEIRKEVTMDDFKEYNKVPPRSVIPHVETMYDYLWRYRDVQTPIRAPRD